MATAWHRHRPRLGPQQALQVKDPSVWQVVAHTVEHIASGVEDVGGVEWGYANIRRIESAVVGWCCYWQAEPFFVEGVELVHQTAVILADLVLTAYQPTQTADDVASGPELNHSFTSSVSGL